MWICTTRLTKGVQRMSVFGTNRSKFKRFFFFCVKDGGFRQFLIALSGIKSESKYVYWLCNFMPPTA